jgi:hypothetical protein
MYKLTPAEAAEEARIAIWRPNQFNNNIPIWQQSHVKHHNRRIKYSGYHSSKISSMMVLIPKDKYIVK